MKLGVIYPTIEAAGDPDRIRRFIKGVETAGLDYVAHFDHVLKASHADREPKLSGPFSEKHTFDDPFVFFAFAAAITDTVEFSTGVLILPQRQTALVAQQAAGIDLLSKERLRLGVGVGWNPVEYTGLGQDFHTRGKRLDEQIRLLRQLWTTPLVDFHGQFDRIDRAGINPRPKRSLPIWVGGHADAAFQRGAHYGDGFVFSGGRTKAFNDLERVRHHLRAAGRPAEGFGLELLVHGESQQSIIEILKAWRDAGGTHGGITTINLGFGDNIDAHIAYATEIRRQVYTG